MYPRSCPHCKSTHLVRSRRKGHEWIAALIGLFPYRCQTCLRRTFRFGRGTLPSR